MKKTSELLCQRHSGQDGPGANYYADLDEHAHDGGAAAASSSQAAPSTSDADADVSTASFKALPLDAQIQVMQEKAAQRLLAQTLHQQVPPPLPLPTIMAPHKNSKRRPTANVWTRGRFPTNPRTTSPRRQQRLIPSVWTRYSLYIIK